MHTLKLDKALTKWGYNKEETPIDFKYSKVVTPTAPTHVPYTIEVYVPKEGDTILFAMSNKKENMVLASHKLPKYPLPTTGRWLSRKLVNLAFETLTEGGNFA